MRSFKNRKYRKTKVRKARKSNVRKLKARKSMVRKLKARKTKRMKGGNKTLSGLLNIDLGSPEATLKGLEADVYSVEHSPLNVPPRAPGMNVGQPNNSPYTGFGWYQ